MRGQKPTLGLAFTLLVAAILLFVALAPAAHAEDRIYWTGAFPAYTNLDGTGQGGYLEVVDEMSGYSPTITSGIAFDPAANRIYVAGLWGAGFEISSGDLETTVSDVTGYDMYHVAHLDTTGATVDGVMGVAIYPAANKIYWANISAGISFANLDGTGEAADLDTTGATTDQPIGVTIYPAANKVFWANFEGDKISYANLDGSGGGGDLDTTGATVDGPSGVAIDPAANKIYWANAVDFLPFGVPPGTISYANLDGTGDGGDLDTTGATVLGSRGLALDPVENRVYWANPGKGTIAFANLDGTGDGGELEIDQGGYFPVLFKEPSATEPPKISEGNGQSRAAASAKGVVGRRLSCSKGRWSGDLIGAFNYSAPRSFAYRWLRDGAKVPGATGKRFTPKKTGSYRCRVRASNEAGSSSEKSRGVEVGSSSACKKAKKKLKKAKKKLKKAKKSGKPEKIKKAKKKLKKAKKQKKKAC